MDRGQAVAEAQGTLVRFPNASKDQMAVALTILGGVGLLFALRKGMKGIGNFELTASTVGGLEWLGYYIVVNGVIRVYQIKYPDSGLSKALYFLA